MQTSKRQFQLLVPIFLGVGAFFAVMGPFALDPQNIAWLASGDDIAQHYLGSVFYRYGPWSLPLGLNPNFGLEVSSSIVFSDSIPIMAFLLKLLNHLLPEPFQYFGIWVLMCFILQAVFAWLLIGLFSKDVIVKIFGTGLLLFAPPMIYRIGLHTSLASHFLILIALFLILRPSKKNRVFYWCALLGLSSLVAFYLFAMVSVLWFTDLLDKTFKNNSITIKLFLNELALVFVTLLFTFWQAGYFAIPLGSSGEWGFGFFRMNLFSIFNPMGWSQIVDRLYINENSFEYEGFNYFGFGIIIALFVVLWKIGIPLKKIVLYIRLRPFLFSGLLLLTLLSVSHNIGIGPWNISFKIPEVILSIGSVLRASGRLFWPVWYLLVLAIIFGVVRGFPRQTCVAILALAMLIQIIDTSNYWRNLRRQMMTPKALTFASPLTSHFWNDVPKLYKKVIRRPIEGWPVDWQVFAAYAGSKRMATDSVYQARVNYEKFRPLNEGFEKDIKNSNLDSDALFIVSNHLVLPILAKINSQKYLFARIDNVNVLAPNWNDCKSCSTVDSNLHIANLFPRYRKGQVISFSNSAPRSDLVLSHGWWGWSDNWGTWAVGSGATMSFLIPNDNPTSLIISARALVSPLHPEQIVDVLVNDKLIKRYKFTIPEHNKIYIPITPELVHQGYMTVQLQFLNPIQPKNIGMGNDSRALSLGVESAIFQ
jgi:uncharacterized membrane protein